MKILSPAGNFESLKMAVYNGADEVYLGINDFNARNNIDGFNMQNLAGAVDFAHLYGVKVNLAINILFTDQELQSALNIIIDAYNMGVDCFIIQDLALASLIHSNYPQIEIHASTQMGIHNLEGVQNISKYGFKRIVLARETPLEEVKRIKANTNIELEYFVQGALCVSFSGNCYLSSYLCNASGNRGKCKQLCRLPFSLEKNGKILKHGYLLSAKDFNMIEKLNELKEAGVDVLKIEGRARRPYYVGVSTREYYKALHGQSFDKENLKLAFNRDFTQGYFNGNGDIISKYNNHIGIYIGKIEKVNFGKKFNEVIFSSNKTLSPKSTFKVFHKDEEHSTLSAYDLKHISNNKYLLTTTQKLIIGDDIHLIIDNQDEESMLNSCYKKPLLLDIYLEENKPIKISYKGQEIIGEVCEKAIKSPLSKDDIISCFKKNENFDVTLNFCKFDNVFMTKQKLNEFRRTVFDIIKQNILSKYYHDLEKIDVSSSYKIIKLHNYQIAESLDEKLTAQTIIYSPETYNLNDIILFKEKCEKEQRQAFLDLPNFALKQDIEFLRNIIKTTQIGIVANNYYALSLSDNMIIGGGLNVYNTISAQEFDKPVLTAETDISSMIKFPYMTLRHCPFKNHLNANCKNCPYETGYYLRMESGKNLKLKRKKQSTCTFYLTD